MFVSALKIVQQFTRPVIISTLLYSGEVKVGCGAFIVLNSEGWILTAGHILQSMILQQKQIKENTLLEEARDGIKNDTRLSPKGRKRELEKLQPNPNWIAKVSYWWGQDNVNTPEIKGDELHDIAVARLEPFNPAEFSEFPTFWNPDDVLPTGKSLCRLGYPFHTIEATYDGAQDKFILAPGSLPLPLFPLDGMHTRVAIVQDEKTGKTAEFIEVSTPGLRGQSGGPVFDVAGLVCGIQSHTRHLPLGFSPTIKQGNREVVEHQFLNVGYALHVKEILAFLKDKGIKVNVVPRLGE
jgi:hypothetical protein